MCPKRFQQDDDERAAIQPIREMCEAYHAGIPDLERENALLREQIALLKEKAALSVSQYVPPTVFGPIEHYNHWRLPTITQADIARMKEDLAASALSAVSSDASLCEFYHGMTDYPMGEPYTVAGSIPFGKEAE